MKSQHHQLRYLPMLSVCLSLTAAGGCSSETGLVGDPVPNVMKAASLTVGDLIPPPITKSVVIELHIDSYSDFQNAAPPMAAGFTDIPTLEKTGVCIVHLQAYDAQPDRWAILGERLQHEADHCLLGYWHKG
jgi:hypothetical protein